MATEGVEETLSKLARKIQDDYTASEYEIALALARAEGPLSTDELVEETGYTERTIRKRVGTLEERLRGPPLLQRDGDDQPHLHPKLAEAVRAVSDS